MRVYPQRFGITSSLPARGSHYSTTGLCSVVLCIWIAHPCGFAQDPPAPAEAARVVAIDVQPSPARTAAAFLPLVTQKVGMPPDRARIRESIRNLFATGEFADVKAVQLPATGGVRLLFRTQPNFFLGTVKVEDAPDPPTDSELLDASGLEIGRLFNRGEVEEAVGSMRDRLASYGYHVPKIDSHVALDNASGSAVMSFLVTAGPMARTGHIAFTGNTLFAPGDLLKATRLVTGKPLSRERLQRAVASLQKFYERKGRVTASVSVAGQTFVAASNAVDLVFHIDAGPVVTVAAEGADLSSRISAVFCGNNCVLHREVPVFQEHAADSELIEEGRRNLEEHLQQRGFFEARVVVRQQTPRPGVLRIEYRITPGPREEVDSVSFQGNRYFSPDDLRDSIAARASNPLLPDFIPGARGNYSDVMVRDDAAAIAGLYRANGFSSIQVTPVVNRAKKGKTYHLGVVFRIQEGPQMLVGALAIHGNQAISTQELQRLLTSAPGQPYSDLNVATDRDSILSRYYNAGYSQAQLSSSITRVAAQNRVDITYTLNEGPRQMVNQVFIRGQRFVRRNIIGHQVEVKPGTPVSQVQMLDTQRNLYNLGLFTDVNVAVQNPSGEEASKNIIVNVQEARRYTFNELVGLQVQGGTGGSPSSPTGKTGYSPLLGFDVTRMAMTGRDQTLTFKSRYGTLQKRLLLSYDMPRFLNHPTLRTNFAAQYNDTFDVRTFRARRVQGSVQTEQSHSATTKMIYHLEYRRVDLSFPCSTQTGSASQPGAGSIPSICGSGTVPTISPAEIPILARPEHIAVVSTDWIRDRRDDPLNTVHGNFNTAEVGLARSFGPYSNFGKGFFENAWYHPIGPKERVIIARATRLGFELPFGGLQTVTLTDPVSNISTTTQEHVIPLPERFFSGGSDTLRGFNINQAGPRDPFTGFPIGGSALFINNLELRYPLIGRNIGGVLFYDIGNVYTTLHDLLRALGRFHAPSATDLNFTSHTVGTGVRYRTPVGPVRLDLGWDLNPPAFQVIDYPLTCPSGQTSCPVHTTQQLGHLHFFFSIGQTF